MVADECITGCLLLEQVHVTGLHGQRFTERIGYSNKKPILVKVIIRDLFPQIDKCFVLKHEIRHAGLNDFAFQWYLKQEIIPQPPVETVPLGQLIAPDPAVEPLLRPNPLH